MSESYDPHYFLPLFEAEDRHFWFRARNQVIAEVVKQIIGGLTPGYKVLEVGCGTGNVLRVLEDTCAKGSVTGMDLFPEGLRYARQRTGCPLVVGDMMTPPFNDGRFGLIGLFDVLEHLSDDDKVLRHLAKMLAPGGSLLLTVPAYPELWSDFDEAAHHCRRYRPAELEQRLVDAGYRVEYLTPYMVTMFPLVWASRKLGARAGERSQNDLREAVSRDLAVRPGLNTLLRWWLRGEVPLIRRRWQLPFGSSLLALARKG
jgi:SAM-dependent methyltransferase